MTTRFGLPRGALLVGIASWALAPAGAEGQLYRFGDANSPGAEVGRHGTAIVVESDGPALFGRREFYRPVPPLELKNRWVMVQDSTFGLVFAEPSGVKPDLDSYDADVFLRALDGVKAVEVRALTFNVWGELSAYLGVTILAERRPGETWDINARWKDGDVPTREHRTSIMWINRVMFEDESILEAGIEPVAAAWGYVTGSEFHGLPEEVLLRANGP